LLLNIPKDREEDTLFQDVTVKFSSEEFNSRLDNFFISKDGHFVKECPTPLLLARPFPQKKCGTFPSGI
jgi:hypothetical protein